MRSPVAPSTASKLEEARSGQIKIAPTHHRDGTAAIKDAFIVMSTSAGKRDSKSREMEEKKEFHGLLPLVGAVQ